MAAAQLEFRFHCTGLEAGQRESSACDIEFHFSGDRRQHRDKKEDARTRVLASSLFAAQRHLLMNQHLERIMLRCVTKDFVRFDDLVEGELVRDEVLGRQLVLGDELQQHPQGVRVHETHRDVDVPDPQFVERELDELWIRNIDISMGLVNTNTLGMLLKLVTQHKLPAENFVTHKFSFDQIIEAYEVFGNAAKHDALKVLIH